MCAGQFVSMGLCSTGAQFSSAGLKAWRFHMAVKYKASWKGISPVTKRETCKNAVGLFTHREQAEHIGPILETFQTPKESWKQIHIFYLPPRNLNSSQTAVSHSHKVLLHQKASLERWQASSSQSFQSESFPPFPSHSYFSRICSL